MDHYPMFPLFVVHIHKPIHEPKLFFQKNSHKIPFAKIAVTFVSEFVVLIVITYDKLEGYWPTSFVSVQTIVTNPSITQPIFEK